MKNNKKTNGDTERIPLSEIQRRTQDEMNRRSAPYVENRSRPANIPVRRISPDTADPYSMNGQPAQNNSYGYYRPNSGNSRYAYGQPVQNSNVPWNGQVPPNNQYNPDYRAGGYYSPQQNQGGYTQPNYGGYTQQNYGGYTQQNGVQPPVQPPVRPSVKHKKKRHGFIKFLLCLVLIFSLLSGAVFGYAYSLCSKTEYIETPARTIASDAMYSNSVYNVLLVGTDKESGGVSRSDTMMLLSIDKKNQQLKMTSFLRDMWVEIPGHGNAKLNAAFAYGGAALMMQTIENNFKVRIDNYILVDFDMFKALIDGLGGVDVEITEKEAEFINRTSHAKVNEGMNHLNGDYALIYVRIRKLDSDFMRTQRQRKVMTAILNQAKENGIFSSISAASEVLPYITTDISAFNLTLKAFGALKYIGYESSQLQIPLDGAYSDKRIDGQAVLKVDFDRNIDSLQQFIYG